MIGMRGRDGSADPKTPVCVLIKPQDLAGKGHAERHQQQENSEDPRQLAGNL